VCAFSGDEATQNMHCKTSYASSSCHAPHRNWLLEGTLKVPAHTGLWRSGEVQCSPRACRCNGPAINGAKAPSPYHHLLPPCTYDPALPNGHRMRYGSRVGRACWVRKTLLGSQGQHTHGCKQC
jgi:hypothetical protein